MSTVPPADYRKPVPTEPWRYVCPECHSHVRGRASTVKYRCSNGHLMHKGQLWDRKHGRTAHL